MSSPHPPGFGCRHTFTFMSTTFSALTYMFRLNLSVAIVAMVNERGKERSKRMFGAEICEPRINGLTIKLVVFFISSFKVYY